MSIHPFCHIFLHLHLNLVFYTKGRVKISNNAFLCSNYPAIEAPTRAKFDNELLLWPLRVVTWLPGGGCSSDTEHIFTETTVHKHDSGGPSVISIV